MSDNEALDIEDDFVTDETEVVVDAPAPTSKSNLAKRRVIDNLLEDRRLSKALSDYDFDI